jgi:hypothetical protein
MAKKNHIIEGLKSLGGKDQLIMFLTGPAGAGKTTSIKLTQTFCEKFSLACSIPFDQYSFYFTAYTGAASSEYGGITTLSALQIKPMSNDITEASESTRSTLNKVKILIMDKISFMSVKDLQLISKRLQELFKSVQLPLAACPSYSAGISDNSNKDKLILSSYTQHNPICTSKTYSTLP